VGFVVDFQKVIGDQLQRQIVEKRSLLWSSRRLSAISVVEFQKVIGDQLQRQIVEKRSLLWSSRRLSAIAKPRN
jgi:tryptophan synthase beta subunit